MWWLPPVLGAAAGSLPGLLEQDADVAVAGAFAGAGVGFFVDSMIGDTSGQMRCYELRNLLGKVERNLYILYDGANTNNATRLMEGYSQIPYLAGKLAAEVPEQKEAARLLGEGAGRLHRTYQKAAASGEKMTPAMSRYVDETTRHMFDYWQRIENAAAQSCAVPKSWSSMFALKKVEEAPAEVKQDIKDVVKKFVQREKKRRAPRRKAQTSAGGQR